MADETTVAEAPVHQAALPADDFLIMEADQFGKRLFIKMVNNGDGTVSVGTSAPIAARGSVISPHPGVPGDVSTPAANVAAVVNYAAISGQAHVLSSIAWSYTGAPVAGNLKVEDGAGTVIFSMDIVAAGAGVLPGASPKLGTVGAAMIITLSAGGAGVVGKLSCGHWTV